MKKILRLVLLCGVFWTFCWCLGMGIGYFLSMKESYEKYQQEQKIIYVAFSKGDEEKEPMDYTEIADYESKYSAYNSRVMYDTLAPAEQQIYRFYEYAMDNEYTSIFIDSRLLKDLTLTLEDILKLYSMDSPLVQQNYSYSSQETGFTFSYFEGKFQFKVEGSVFKVQNFSHEAMEKKKEALTAAEAVFATMPPNLSQLEQARFFFRYLTREVQYSLSENKPGEQNNLYDAFIGKKTQCDGFTNSFALLCSMAKIPCVEKIVTPEDGESGHTWNVFCADGVWYNADLALSDDYTQTHKEFDIDFSFGFSDGRKEDVPDMAERFPPCTTDLLPVEFTASSAADKNLLKGLKQTFQTNGKNFVLLCLEEGELAKSDLQKIANYLDSDIRTITETWGGKTHYFIFKV